MDNALQMRKELLSREYGANILKIVQFIKDNPDKQKRTEQAKLLIKLIEKLHPSVKYAEDSETLLWGHIYIMSDCDLDVDVEFEKPEISITKPEKVSYPTVRPKNRHYGRNVEILADHLSNLKDEESKKEAGISLGKLLKTLYLSWNNDSVGDELILKDIERLTKGSLTVDKSLIGGDDSKNSPFYTRAKKGLSNTNTSKPTHNRNNNNNNKRNSNKGGKRPQRQP